jgi:uncharacterized protein YukE
MTVMSTGVMDIAPSPNVDSSALNGGFSALCRPLITGGSPQSVITYAVQLGDKVRALTSLLTELERARDQLRQVWQSGAGSAAAMQKLTRSFDTLQRTLQAILRFISELQTAAIKVDLAGRGANAAIRVAEPTVAALRSNPYTQAAATAMATSTTASIASFLKGISSLLTAIGQNNIGAILSSLVTIASDVARLSTPAATSGTTPVSTLPSGGTAPGTPTSPITLPTSPTDLGSLTSPPTSGGTPTGSASGTPTAGTGGISAGGTGGTGGTLTGGTGGTLTGGTAGGGYPYGYPGGSPGTGFIPVAPGIPTLPGTGTTMPGTGATMPGATTPATPPAGHHVTVTVNSDGSVVVDSDISADVDVVEKNADGTEIDKHITVNPDRIPTPA